MNEQGGWFRIANSVVDDHLGKLPPGAIAVYVVLARFSDATGRSHPSIGTIAGRLAMSRRSVQVHLRSLEAAGLVSIDPSPGRGSANTYTLLAPIGKDAAGCAPDRVDESARVQPAAPPNGADGCSGLRPQMVPMDAAGCAGGRSGLRTGAQPAAPHKDFFEKTKNSKKKARGEEEVEIPECLRSERFEAAWAEWLEYRTQRRLSRAPMTLARQLGMLARLGTDGSVEAIERSIRNGWQGLFEEKGSNNGNGKWDPVAAGRYRP